MRATCKRELHLSGGRVDRLQANRHALPEAEHPSRVLTLEHMTHGVEGEILAPKSGYGQQPFGCALKPDENAESGDACNYARKRRADLSIEVSS